MILEGQYYYTSIPYWASSEEKLTIGHPLLMNWIGNGVVWQCEREQEGYRFIPSRFKCPSVAWTVTRSKDAPTGKWIVIAVKFSQEEMNQEDWGHRFIAKKNKN